MLKINALGKKTTIYDIAKSLNLTVSTVSRALSGNSVISMQTTKAVLQVAKKLNYSPNKLASALKLGKTYIVGVIVPSIQSHFFSSVIHSIEKRLNEKGYRIILCQSNESLASEINGVKTLLEAQVDGIMASISLETKTADHFREIINQNKPLILFDRTDEKLNVPTVLLDDHKAGYIAAKHLIEKGYKKIAFLTTKHKISIFTERLQGYKDALIDAGMAVSDDHILFGGLSIKDGRFGANKLLRGMVPPDAFIAADDFTALGVIKKLKELSISPPKIGVIGFANEGFSDYISPNLSTIDQHPNQMGWECAELFFDMVYRPNLTSPVKKIVIQPTLIERASTALVKD